jgi:hypothetical protein
LQEFDPFQAIGQRLLRQRCQVCKQWFPAPQGAAAKERPGFQELGQRLLPHDVSIGIHPTDLLLR